MGSPDYYSSPCPKRRDGTHLTTASELGECCVLCGAVPVYRGRWEHGPTTAERRALVRAIARRDGSMACFYCEHELVEDAKEGDDEWKATLDHFIPRARRGTDALENLVLACQRCNHRKGDEMSLVMDVIRALRTQRDDLRASLDLE